jgi:hypothetical protein
MKDWVRGCNWRQTKDCDPDGKREPESDRHCGAQVPTGNSGYCQCVDHRITAKSSCEHGASEAGLTCAQECAKLKPGDPGQKYEFKVAAEQAYDADAHHCVHWRATGGCDGAGEREPEHDKGCEEEIPSGLSGYCECEGGRTGLAVECKHPKFSCDEVCDITGKENSAVLAYLREKHPEETAPGYDDNRNMADAPQVGGLSREGRGSKSAGERGRGEGGTPATLRHSLPPSAQRSLSPQHAPPSARAPQVFKDMLAAQLYAADPGRQLAEAQRHLAEAAKDHEGCRVTGLLQVRDSLLRTH